MSHSRIVVLDNSEYDLDEVFESMRSYGNGVDYVTESDSDFDGDFEWFMDYSSDLGFTCLDGKFKIADSNRFWNEMEKDIRNFLDKGINVYRWNIEDRVKMKNTFWIWVDGELFTLPYFVEFYGDKNRDFKITKFLDYHFQFWH